MDGMATVFNSRAISQNNALFVGQVRLLARFLRENADHVERFPHAIFQVLQVQLVGA